MEIKLTQFNASGIFTKDPRAIFIQILSWSGGGGGGSGKQGMAGTAFGGSAGTAGSFVTDILLSTNFDTTEVVTVGAGGIGGSPQTTANTNGNNATDGGFSSVGNFMVNKVYNGSFGSGIYTRGAGGGITSPASPQFVLQISTFVNMPISPYGIVGNVFQFGPQSSGANARWFGASPFSNTAIDVMPTPGGDGAIATAGVLDGQTGGSIFPYGIASNSGPAAVPFLQEGGAGGSESSDINGQDGTDMQDTSGLRLISATGGGGGCWDHINNIAGNGGNGGVPSAGAGGGAGSLNGFDSGAGGDGGRGQVVILEYLGDLTVVQM